MDYKHRMEQLRLIIEQAWQDHDQLKKDTVSQAISQVIELLDKGKLRVADIGCGDRG